MASRNQNLNISISATTAGLERGVTRAEAELNRLRKAHADAWAAINAAEQQLQRETDQVLAEVTARQEAAQAALEQVGMGLLGVGGALTAGLGLAARAAIEWESAWAGVTKTVDGTAEEMQVLEEGLRGLALQIPVTSTELAGIAATAGQLGVARENILEFTETIAGMAVATNLTAEEAATAMARFANVMGTPQDEVDRLGATIVELGNNSATTEAEILEMALRIAGAGRTVGLTEADVLSFAAALSSVGLQAEGGGSAISRVMMMISDATRAGGDDLTAFARVAGTSAEEFATAFRDDPAQAISMFVAGLGDIQQAGGDVFQTLREVGVVDIEVRDALLRAAGASDVLAESLRLGGEAWDANTALVEEAAARYATTESQMIMAQNAINEFGISLGEHLLPIIGDAAEHVTNWGVAWSTLDASTQGAVTGIGGTVGAVSLLTGALITAGPRLLEFRDAMQTLATDGSTRLRRGLGTVATFLTGPYGAALGAVMLLGAAWLDQKAQQIAAEQDWADAFAQSNGVIDESIKLKAVQRAQDEGLIDLADRAGISTSYLIQALLEEGAAREALAGVTVSQLESTYESAEAAERAGSATQQLKQHLEEIYGPGTDWADLTVEQQEALRGLFDGMNAVIPEIDRGRAMQEAIAQATDETADQYLTAADAADGYRQSLEELHRTTLGLIDAEIAWEQSIDDASDSLDRNGATLDLTTQAGRDNQRALNDLITDGGEYIAMLKEAGVSNEELREEHERARKKIYEVAIAFGASEEEAREYADALGDVPPEVTTEIEVEAQGRWSTTGSYGAYPPSQRPPGMGYADGGAVHGPGGPRDDLIPAMLSNGEHVIPADEVDMAGGQDAIYRLRAMIRAGYVRFADGGAVEVQRFARGGAVRPRPAQIIDDHDEDTRIQLQRMTQALIDRVGNSMATEWKRIAGSTLAVVNAWRLMIGTPYSWGGGGPGGPSLGFGRGANTVGFDCSSLMQYGWARVGVSLPRTTYDQIRVGSAVPRGQERPGDLVFPHLGHVAGVETPGTLIHAPYTGATVSRRPMYGHVIAIRRPKKFDAGGIWGSGESGINLSGRPERVLSPAQTAAFERLVGVLDRRGGDGAAAPVAVHIHHVPGYSTPQDIQRGVQHLERLARAGRPR